MPDRAPGALCGLLLLLTTVVLTGRSGLAQATQPIPVPADIDATGQVDVTTALVGLLSSVPSGSTVTFPTDGRYRVEGTLRLQGSRRLTIEGNGSLLFATTTADISRRHVSLIGAEDIVIRNLKVKGANPAAGTGEAAYNASLEAQHGFELLGVARVLLEGVSVSYVFGDFVYIGTNRTTGVASRDVTVRGSRFERNGRQGIGITAAENVRIERNFLSDTRRATFDLEPGNAAWSVRNIQIADNEVGPGRLLFLASLGQGRVDGVFVTNNRLSGRPLSMSIQAPQSQTRSGFRITGNSGGGIWSGDGGAMMRFLRVTDVVVSGNRQLLAGERVAAVLSDQSCVTAERNEFIGTGEIVRVADPVDCATAPAPVGDVRPLLPVQYEEASGETETSTTAGVAGPRGGTGRARDLSWLGVAVAVGVVLAGTAAIVGRRHRSRVSG